MVIHKYELPILEKFSIELPQVRQIIRVSDVDGKFYLWALVEETSDKVSVEFEMYKTGQPIKTDPKNLNYLGFCKIFVGMELCLYVFEVLEHKNYSTWQ